MNSQTPFNLLPDPAALAPSKDGGQWMGLVEGAVLLGAVFAIERLGSFDLHALPVHPFVLVIALLAAQYGTLAGITTALSATALSFLGGMLPERVVGEEYFNYLAALWAGPLLWVVIAVIVGIVADRHRRARIQAEASLYDLRQERDLIAAQCETLQARAKRLERLAAGFDTVKRRPS